MLGLSASRYHRWRQAEHTCGLDDQLTCPRLTPTRLTAAEILAMADHLPVGAARAHWQRDALHRQDRELMALERQEQDAAFYACRRLLTTLEA